MEEPHLFECVGMSNSKADSTAFQGNISFKVAPGHIRVIVRNHTKEILIGGKMPV